MKRAPTAAHSTSPHRWYFTDSPLFAYGATKLQTIALAQSSGEVEIILSSLRLFFFLLYFETYKNNIKHWFDSKSDCYWLNFEKDYYIGARSQKQRKTSFATFGLNVEVFSRVQLESLSRLGVTWNIRRIRDEKTLRWISNADWEALGKIELTTMIFFFLILLPPHTPPTNIIIYRRVVVVTSRSVFRYIFCDDFSFSSNLSLMHMQRKKPPNISNFHWSVWNRFDLDCCFPRKDFLVCSHKWLLDFLKFSPLHERQRAWDENVKNSFHSSVVRSFVRCVFCWSLLIANFSL